MIIAFNLIKPCPKRLHLMHNSSLDSGINHQGYILLQIIDINLRYWQVKDNFTTADSKKKIYWLRLNCIQFHLLVSICTLDNQEAWSPSRDLLLGPHENANHQFSHYSNYQLIQDNASGKQGHSTLAKSSQAHHQ